MLTDLDGWKLWMPGLVAAEKRTSGGFGVGTEWKETRKIYGREAAEYFEVTRCDAPTRLGLRVDGSRGASGRGEFLFNYELRPEAGGTRVQLQGEIRFPGWFWNLLGRAFLPGYRKACARDLEAMKAYCERTG